jgi:hypothetical protein
MNDAAARLFRLLATQNCRSIVLPKNTRPPSLEPDEWAQKLAERPASFRPKRRHNHGHKSNQKST